MRVLPRRGGSPSSCPLLSSHGYRLPGLLGFHSCGPSFTEKLLEETADLNRYAPIVILRLRHMTAIHATGLHGLEILSDRLKKSGRILLLCGARHQPARMLKRADFIEHIGEHNILPHAQAEFERAREIQAGFTGLMTMWHTT